MKKCWCVKREILLAQLLILSFLLVCASVTTTWASTTVSGRIDTDTTWDLAGSPYIVTSAIQVYGDTVNTVTLTIDAGVEVRFNTNIGMSIGSGANKGTLIASGTSVSPITFTREPASGYWGQLTFNDGTIDASTLLEYVNMDYSAGVSFSSASPTLKNCSVTDISNVTNGFYLASSDPTLENVDIAANASYGIYLASSSPVITGGSLANSNAAGHGIYGSGSPSIDSHTITIVDTPGKYGYYATGTASALSVTNSTVGNGLYIPTINITPTITGNTFTNADSSPLRAGANIIDEIVTSNTINGLTSAGKIEILGEQVRDDAIWPDLGAPYEVVSGIVGIYKDATTKSTLTIAPGVEVRFSASSYFQVGYSTEKGALVAQGAVGNRIKFTRSAATGNFPTTYFYNGADDATTILEYVDIDYSKGLYFQSASPTIKNCTITNVDGYYALYLSTSNPVIENVDITVDYNYGTYLSNSSPTITGGSLLNTQSNSHGIYGSGSPVISGYDIQVFDTAGKYGIYLTSTTSALSLTTSTVQNGLYLASTAITPTVTGNTFSRSDSSPPHMGANIIFDVMANNTYADLTAAGKIEMVGEQINHDVTLSKLAAPYVFSGTTRVYKSTTEAATLTIEAGAQVQFASNARLEIGYSTSKGVIKALGTVAEPITMTRSGVSGAWAGIYFNNGSDDVANVFDYVNITYSNGVRFYSASPTLRNVNISGGTSYGLYFSSSSPVLENVNVSTNSTYAAYLTNSSPQFQGGSVTNLKSSGYGIYGSTSSPTVSNLTVDIVETAGYYGIYLPSTTSALSITNSTVDNSLYIGTANIQPTITGNTFNGLDLATLRIGANSIGDFIDNNTINGLTSAGKIELTGEKITRNTTLKKLIAPYTVVGTISIYNSSTPTPAPVLTIEPGVELRFNQNTGITAGYVSYPGILNIQGSAAEPVLLTANHASPTPGYWTGIALNSGVGYDSTIDHAIIEYAGSGYSYYNAGITMSYSGSTIRSTTIRQTKNSGIYFSSTSASPLIDSCDISGSSWGIYSINSNPEVVNSRIYNNSTAGIWNTSASSINAKGNWWGDPSGPTHADNSGGTGDVVSANVAYNPWLSEVPNENITLIQPSVAPESINPDGGSVTFAGTLSKSANWTILVKDDIGATVKTMTGSSTTINQIWTGDKDQGGAVSNGLYTYTIDATDGTYSSAQVAGSLVATSHFTAEISIPADNQIYHPFANNEYIDITGSADAVIDFQDYVLEYGVGENPAQWYQLAMSTDPITDGIMHYWATWNFTEDLYTLRLTVNDTQGGSAVRIYKVRFLRVNSSSQTESYISPNADGVQDNLQVDVAYSCPVDWTMSVLDDQLTVVRTLTGSGDIIAPVWDGKDEVGQVVVDGTYTYQIDATTTEYALSADSVTGSVVVDSTPPVAQVDTPLVDAIVFNDVVLSGTASDDNLDTYRVELEQVGGAGGPEVIAEVLTSVVNDDLETWSSNDGTNAIPYSNDDYLLWLIVTDKAGNNASVIRPVTLNNLQFFNVSATAHGLNTRLAETTTISYELNAPAFVTLKVVPELQGATGTPVYTATDNCAATGPCSFVWDGTDTSAVAVLDDAYIYVLEADDGTVTDTYAPDPPAGEAIVSCSQEVNYYPYINDPLTITYAPDTASRVDVNISWGPQYFKVVDGKPHIAGSYTYDWNGRDPVGDILDYGGKAYCSSASLLPENHIVTSGNAPNISLLEADPYRLGLSYGQFTRVRYTLDNDAVVTVRIIPPSGSAQTILNAQAQLAGTHEVVWDALSSSDANEKTYDVNVEGDYLIEVEAVNADTGAIATRMGNLAIEP